MFGSDGLEDCPECHPLRLLLRVADCVLWKQIHTPKISCSPSFSLRPDPSRKTELDGQVSKAPGTIKSLLTL